MRGRKVRTIPSVALLSAFLGALLWIGCEEEQPQLAPTLPGNDPVPTLDCIAPMIIENCATAGCHDSETRVHGMDLSTPSGIYQGFREHGLDICHNRIIHRVLPGDPDDSFVVDKVEGNLDCEESLPMPPPPLEPLSSEQIERLRAWIAAGAPPDCTVESLDTVSTAGAPGSVDGHMELHETSSGGSTSTSTSTSTTATASTTASVGGSTSTSSVGGTTGTSGVTGTTGTAGTSNEDQTGLVCTPEMPCPGDGWNYACVGNFCAETWECFAHKPDPPSLHPCSTDIIPYCACDGTTFEAPIDCPNRPYTHPGSCDEGFNCDVWKVSCEDEPPTCAEGELASVVDDCWGDCVPATSCRCQYHWQCGDVPEYMCVSETLFCEPRPPEEEL